MMKKFIKGLTTAVAVTSMTMAFMVGCGGTKQEVDNNVPASTEVKEEKKEVKQEPKTEQKEETKAENKDISSLTVGFAQSGNPNPWMVALTESMEDTAKEMGVNYIYTDANDDMATHVANIEDMLEKNLDYLVVAPMEDTGLESVLKKAADKGVPVILTGRTTTGEYVTTVYSDQAWEGERCAELIGNVKADAKVVELRGIEGTSSVAGREKGFRKIMGEKYPEMEIIAQQTANFSREEGMDVMTNIIQSKGADSIDAVYCHNDEMALGAVQAIKDAGLQPGKDILVVGIDGQKEAWEAVKKGEMLGTVQCSPKHGPTVFEVIQKLMKGEKPEKETIVKDEVITAENVDKCEDLVF